MKLSAPIYQLKRQAKLQARKTAVPLNEALNRIAKEQGFDSWSLLAARYANESPAIKMLDGMVPGDLVLLGARPGQGKTILALEIMLEAIKRGEHGAFFTLNYNEADVLSHLQSMNVDLDNLKGMFHLDMSDAICVDYIIESLKTASRGTIVAVDYLQLLDQRRENPELQTQISALKLFAQEAGVIIILISQIDRTYDLSTKQLPDIADVRLPNPVDLTLFTKNLFFERGEGKILRDDVIQI